MKNKANKENKNNNNNLKNKKSNIKKKEPSLFEKYSPINNINFNQNNADQEKKENQHIYLNFYTNQQNEKNIEKEIFRIQNQKFHDKNMKLLKQKEIENKKKREDEIKRKKQEEYENTKEFRDKQIEKLYLASINKYNKTNKNSHKNKNSKSLEPKNKIGNKIKEKNLENKNDNGKIKEYINKFEEREKERIEKEKILEKIKNLPKGTIIMKKNDYDEKLKSLYNERKSYNDELNKMPITNKTYKQSMREAYLINLLEEMDKKIEIFEKKISIAIIDI